MILFSGFVPLEADKLLPLRLFGPKCVDDSISQRFSVNQQQIRRSCRVSFGPAQDRSRQGRPSVAGKQTLSALCEICGKFLYPWNFTWHL